MINKEDLKDWLNENARNEYAKKLEEFIDGEIKKNALKGELTFHISTGEYTRDGSKRTSFYYLWEAEDVSEGNRKIVHDLVIKKYRDFGFDVQRTNVDCGWHNNYFALLFIEIDKVVQEG